MSKNVFCVFGSGNALNPSNHIFHARLNAAAEQDFLPDTIAVFGRHQPSMTDTHLSEAASAIPYLFNRVFSKGHVALAPQDGASIKSIATTCEAILDLYLTTDEGNTVWLVTNWPYMLRTRYLLWCAARRRGLSWAALRTRVYSIPCGGTFYPYLADNGWRAIPWWLRYVLIREILAWGKAIVDPYDEKLNQQRTAKGA